MGVAVPPKNDNTCLFIGLAAIGFLFILLLIGGGCAVFYFSCSSKSDDGFQKGYDLALAKAKASEKSTEPKVIKEVVYQPAPPAPAPRASYHAPPPASNCRRKSSGGFGNSLKKGLGWGLGLGAGFGIMDAIF